MVIDKERSAFAETLYRALQASGHKYIGKLVITDEEYESYRGLSTESLARTYTVNHKLAEKAKVMNMLSYIYTENIKGNYSLSMVTMCEQFDLYSISYMFYFRYHCKYVKVTGQAANTRYQWVCTKEVSKPIFSVAEEIFDEVNIMSKFRLLDSHKDTIDKEGWQVLPESPIGLMYKGKSYSHKKTTRDNKVKNAKPVTFSRELSRTKKEQVEEIPEVIEDITIDQPTDSKPVESPNVDGTIFILNQRMELYKSIIENWEVYCKKLEEEILTLKSKLK